MLLHHRLRKPVLSTYSADPRFAIDLHMGIGAMYVQPASRAIATRDELRGRR